MWACVGGGLRRWFFRVVALCSLEAGGCCESNRHFDAFGSWRTCNGEVDEAFDLVLRATSTPDPGLITRVLTEIEFRLVASPAYIAATALPTKLSDLDGRDLLAYTDMSLTGPMTWKSQGKKHSVAFRVVLRSGNESLLREAALAGKG